MEAIGDTSALMKSLQATTIREAQKNFAPHRKTGHLQRATVRGPLTKTSAVVRVNVPYAAPMEFGSKPHIIKPRNGKVLAWGGERRLSGRLRSGSKPTNFAAFVHHPGNKPYPFLRPGAETALREHGIEPIIKAWNGAA
jgi:phage gpG-like protein